MEIIQIRELSFCYPDGENKVLDNISLDINKGEFIVICGQSGCGKSTLLRLLCQDIAPFGIKNGKIHIAENTKVGFVGQNAESEIVTEFVYSSLAFGLENMGVPNGEMKRQVCEMAMYFGIEDLFDKKVEELSGGQQQIINLASVLVMKPDILLLDEPTSKLDKIAADEFFVMIRNVCSEFGITVVLVEHRLDELAQSADRIIAIEEGKIIADERPDKIYKYIENIDKNHRLLNSMPVVQRILADYCIDNLPCNIREAKKILQDSKYNNLLIRTSSNNLFKKTECTDKKNITRNVIILRKMWFRYSKEDKDILKNLSIEISKGSIHFLLGGNGSGKTTLLKVIAGIKRPYKGRVKSEKTLIMPQDPKLLFLKDTIYEDLVDTGKQYELDKEYVDKMIDEYEEYLEMKKILKMHPYDLSGGEIQKAALLKLLICGTKVLLLDEPTKGLDSFSKNSIKKIFNQLKKQGYTIVVVSHDIEFASECADKCSMLFNGEIINTDKPDIFFKKNQYYTTYASRLMRNFNDDVITCEEAQDYMKLMLDKTHFNEMEKI